MKIDLAGKVALVTASTAGIGFAIAKGLAESGAEVILNGRSEQSVNAAIARLQNEVPGAKARPAIADLSDADGAAQLLRAVTGVDILVNNAGIYGRRISTPPTTRLGQLLADQRHVRRTPVAGAAPGDGQ